MLLQLSGTDETLRPNAGVTDGESNDAGHSNVELVLCVESSSEKGWGLDGFGRTFFGLG